MSEHHSDVASRMGRRLPNLFAAGQRGYAFLTCPACDREETGGHFCMFASELGIEVWCALHDARVELFTPERVQLILEHTPECEHCKQKEALS